jgi:uncharacterized protein (DUF2141 family)
MKYFIFMIMISFLYSSSIFGQSGKLEIAVTEIRNEKGDIRVALFQQEDGFPNDHKKAFYSGTFDIAGTQLNFTIEDLPYGEYALAILHDENGNEKMDFNFLRMPKEGYGVSNNVTRSLGPPKFKDAKFMLSSVNMQMEITLNY